MEDSLAAADVTNPRWISFRKPKHRSPQGERCFVVIGVYIRYHAQAMSGNQDKQFGVKRSRTGLGLFAEQSFKKDDFVIEYTGEIIQNEEADRRGNRYIFEISKRRSIDGSTRANTARYLNHSCNPNCEAEIDGARVMIYSLRGIKAGEELTYDYGKEYFEDFIQPVGCRCTSCFA